MISPDEQREKKQNRVPEFASGEEAAEFWDTHDFTDYLDEVKVISVKFSDVIEQAVIVRFDSDTFDKLHRMASKRGVFPDALIHDWVVEGMKKAQAAAPESRSAAMSSAE